MRNNIRPLIIYSATAALMAVLPVFALPYVANNLGPEAFGLFSASRYTMQMLTLFCGSFLGFGLSRVFYEVDARKYYSLMNGANLTSLLLSLAVLLVFLIAIWLAPDYISGLLGNDKSLPVGEKLALTVTGGALFFVWRQNYHRVLVMLPRPAMAAFSELAYNVALFALFVLMVYTGYQWLDLLVGQLLVFAASTLTAALLVLGLRGNGGFFSVDKEWAIDNLKRSIPFFSVGIVSPLLLTFDKYIISGILGLEVMGQYAVTSLYLSGVFVLSGVFQKVYVPETYRLLSQYQAAGEDAIWQGLVARLRLVLLGMLPVVIVIAAGAQIHAKLFFDAQYHDAVRISWIVTLAGCSSFVQIALIPFYDSFGKSRTMSVCAFAGLFLSFLLLAIGAISSGLMGAALGLLTGQLIYTALIIAFFTKLK